MNTTEEKKNWLNFDEIKANADVITVLNHYGLLDKLEQRTNEFVGWCPLGTKTHGKKDSFNFNVKKKTFKCFACKQHGSTLDFVAKYQRLHLRESAEVLAMINNGNAPVAQTPQDYLEDVPDSIHEPASEASEQTEGFTQFAETEGVASQLSSADDPATTLMGMKSNKKLVGYFLSFEEALLQVTSGKTHADNFIVLHKATLASLLAEINEIIGEKK